MRLAANRPTPPAASVHPKAFPGPRCPRLPLSASIAAPARPADRAQVQMRTTPEAYPVRVPPQRVASEGRGAQRSGLVGWGRGWGRCLVAGGVLQVTRPGTVFEAP